MRSEPQSAATADRPLTIGILALQGAFEAHARALTDLGVTAKLIRTPAELADIDGLIIPGGPLEMVFIRAPRITRTGPQVETLASRDNFPVLVREGHLLAATFHPELSSDPRVHQLFLDLIRQSHGQ